MLTGFLDTNAATDLASTTQTNELALARCVR